MQGNFFLKPYVVAQLEWKSNGFAMAQWRGKWVGKEQDSYCNSSGKKLGYVAPTVHDCNNPFACLLVRLLLIICEKQLSYSSERVTAGISIAIPSF